MNKASPPAADVVTVREPSKAGLVRLGSSPKFRLVIGIAFGTAFMWLAARQTDWVLFLQSLRRVNPLLLIVGVAGAVGALWVTALRWRTLLGATCPVSAQDAFDFTMIGFLSGLVLPLRLGDVVKVVLLGRRAQVSRTAILGSVVLERLCDVMILLALAGVFVLTIKLPFIVGTALGTLAVGTGASLLVLWLCVDRWHWLVRPFRRIMPEAMAERALQTLRKFSSGVRALRDRRQFGAALGFSVIAWGLSGLSVTAYVAAFGLAVPWYAGLFVLLLTNLGGILPASPGQVGVYHYLAVTAITVWSSDRGAALGFAIGTHALTMALIAVGGGRSLVRQGLSLRSIAPPELRPS